MLHQASIASCHATANFLPSRLREDGLILSLHDLPKLLSEVTTGIGVQRHGGGKNTLKRRGHHECILFKTWIKLNRDLGNSRDIEGF